MLSKQDMLRYYKCKEEDIFYNKIIANLDISEWIIPYKNDMEYFMKYIFNTVGEKFESPDLILLKNNMVVSSIEDIKIDGTIHIKQDNKSRRSKNDMEYE